MTGPDPGETIRAENQDWSMGNPNGNGSVKHWSLRDQVLDYGMVFVAGLAGAATIGSLLGVLIDATVPSAIGSVIVFLGVLCLLSGGLTGGPSPQ